MTSTVILWKNIHEIADKVCKEFGLKYDKIVPEIRKQVRHYGECAACDRCNNSPYIDASNCNERVLSLRIHQLNKPNIPLAPSTILRTLAHELAHLKVWEHGEKHKKFEREIIKYIKELGYM